MGVFSFMKHAGAKVFVDSKTESKVKSETKIATDEPATEEAAARKFEELIRDLHLEVENLKVTIDDDMATITGKALNQTTKEKVVLVVGNTQGIASVDDQMSVDHAESEAQFHTVVKEDTLGKIAKHYYGNSKEYRLVLEANKPMVKDIDEIYNGQVLRIPN